MLTLGSAVNHSASKYRASGIEPPSQGTGGFQDGLRNMESTQAATQEGNGQTPAEAGKASPLRRPQDALLCNMELPHRGIFYPLGYPVEIVTNNRIVLQA